MKESPMDTTAPILNYKKFILHFPTLARAELDDSRYILVASVIVANGP